MEFFIDLLASKVDFSEVKLPPTLKVTAKRRIIITRNSKLRYKTCYSSKCLLISYK